MIFRRDRRDLLLAAAASPVAPRAPRVETLVTVASNNRVADDEQPGHVKSVAPRPLVMHLPPSENAAESNGQQHDLSDLAYLEYQQVLPQERLPL